MSVVFSTISIYLWTANAILIYLNYVEHPLFHEWSVQNIGLYTYTKISFL